MQDYYLYLALDKTEFRVGFLVGQIRTSAFGPFPESPCKGLDGTRPSGTDTGYQKRLEDADYLSVAAIFSRDGYVRIFRLDNDLEIEIYVTGLEQHENNRFRAHRNFVAMLVKRSAVRQTAAHSRIQSSGVLEK